MWDIYKKSSWQYVLLSFRKSTFKYDLKTRKKDFQGEYKNKLLKKNFSKIEE